jgi:hypothetical protein
MKTFMTAHIWDLEREGLDSALTRLAGQIGVDAISVHAIAPSMTKAYTDETGAVRAFECEDGACFQPDAASYTGTRLRPRVQDWMKQRNAMDALVRAAEKHRLGLRLRMSGCHQPAVASRNQMMACVNILGVTSATWLCPAQAAVREYLASIADDLCRNYAPSLLELAHVDYPDESTSPAFPPVTAGADLSCATELLNWCFCSACRERMAAAGVDVMAFTGHAQGLLRNILELEDHAEIHLTDWLTRDSTCEAIRDVQAQTATTLVAAIRQRVTCDVYRVSTPVGLNPSLECVIEQDSPGGAAAKTSPVYRAYPPYAADGPALVAAIHAAALADHDTIGFSDYGLLSAMSLDWVRQAIRYAKRESTR